MNRSDARGVLLRMLVGLPLLAGLAWACGDSIARGLLPPVRAALGVVVSNIGTPSVNIVFQRPHHRFFAEVVTQRPVIYKDRVLPTGSILHAAMPTYLVLAPAVLIAMAALVWPGLTWRGRLLRLAISLPLLLVLEVMDATAILAIGINDAIPGIGAAYAVDSAWDKWVRIMDGGGRYALAVGAALLAAEIHRRIASVRTGYGGAAHAVAVES
jgi:hypothetical protein